MESPTANDLGARDLGARGCGFSRKSEGWGADFAQGVGPLGGALGDRCRPRLERPGLPTRASPHPSAILGDMMNAPA